MSASKRTARLKIKVPWMFEAEGEGTLPIVIVAGAFVAFLVFVAAWSWRAAEEVRSLPVGAAGARFQTRR